MTPTPGSLAQAASAAIIVSSIVLAMRDWGRTPQQPNAVLRMAARWARAAAALVLAMALVQAVAFGPAAAAGFMQGGGWFMLLQAAAVLVLIPAGAGWAARCEGEPLRLETPRWRDWPWPRLGGALLAMLTWTAVIRVYFDPTPDPGLEHAFQIDQMPALLQWPLLIAVITFAPILEEIIFRHYLLHRVTAALGARPGRSVFRDPRASASSPMDRFLQRRGAKLGAIVITSLLWSIGHAGSFDPYWVKLLQIAPMGLVLGSVAWKFGLEPAIALHWAFNLSLPLLFLLPR